MPFPDDDIKAGPPPQPRPVLRWLQKLLAPFQTDDAAGLDNGLRHDIGLPRRHDPVDIAALLDRAKFDGRRE